VIKLELSYEQAERLYQLLEEYKGTEAEMGTVRFDVDKAKISWDLMRPETAVKIELPE